MPKTNSGKPLLKSIADRLYPAVVSLRIAQGTRIIRRFVRRRKKTHPSYPIRVGFVAQVPEVWDKQLSLFDLMLQDARFDPYIIYVNHFNFVNRQSFQEDPGERLFYENLYGSERVLDFFSAPDIDLAGFDYLFYDRPFNHYLPPDLQTRYTAAYSRLCLILYGAYDWDVPFEYGDFAAGVSLWFASNVHEYDAFRKVFGNSAWHRVFNVGYPAYALYHSLPSSPGRNRILWTPRWSYDVKIGGSHFLEYIDRWIDFVSSHDVSLTIRPHPLMFDNLLREHLMTENEIRQLKERCSNAGICFDSNRIVADTFRDTDILVSDYSSILGLFLAMNKPIVYCPGNIPFTAEFLQQRDAMYEAPSWEEIERHLKNLLTGNDPLAEKRQAVITDCLLKKQNAAKQIADILEQDYKALF